jgi:hypothetical protein
MELKIFETFFSVLEIPGNLLEGTQKNQNTVCQLKQLARAQPLVSETG